MDEMGVFYKVSSMYREPQGRFKPQIIGIFRQV